MKLSTRSRYGLRALLEVAIAGKGPVILRNVCEKQDLSAKYLERIFTDLKKAGIVGSVRGAGGGFLLLRPPSEITVLEIVRALEKGFGTADCVSDPAECDRSKKCPARKAWVRVTEAMLGALGSISLADLLADSGCVESGHTGEVPAGGPARKAGRCAK